MPPDARSPARWFAVRCLFLVFNYPSMGTYMRARAFARLFVARGHEVTICAVSPLRKKGWDEREIDGFRQLETSKWMPFNAIDPRDGWNPIELVQRCWIAARENWDLVYCFEHKPTSLAPALVARSMRGAFMLFDHCDPWGGDDGIFRGYVLDHPGFRELPRWKQWVRRRAIGFEERLERWAPRRAGAATAISALTLSDLRTRGVAEERSLRLYTPSGSVTKKPLVTRDAARGELGIPADVPAIGLLASNVPEEAELWPIWRSMLDRRADLHLLLPGNGFMIVPDWAREGALSARVHLPGYVEMASVPTWLAATDLVWCPMEQRRFNVGRFPHKFFDYIAAARPVASTRVGDIAELVDKHEIGFVTDTMQQLADRSLAVIDDRAQLDAWGDAARQTADDVFSDEAIDAQLAPFLDRVLPASLKY